MSQTPGQAEPLIPRPELTLPALRAAVARVAPGRLPEMFEKMQAAFVRAGEEGSVVPIHMFYREWAVTVEIERHPQTSQTRCTATTGCRRARHTRTSDCGAERLAVTAQAKSQ
jgi:hypothetical protein